MALLPRHLSWFATHRLRLVTGFIHAVPAGRCRFHCHDHLELVLHRTGQGSSRVAGGDDLQFAAGQATLHPAGGLHDQSNQSQGEDICLHLDHGAAPPPALRRAQVLPVPAPLAQEIAALASAPALRSPADQLSLDLRATGVVLGLLARVGPAAPAAFRDGAAGLAARYMAEHLATVGRMEEVARHVGLSAGRLRHLFTATHRIGPVEYLIRLRIGHARELLERTDMRMEEVARASGFATARYFSTVFRRRVGCAPREYRRRAGLWTGGRGRQPAARAAGPQPGRPAASGR